MREMKDSGIEWIGNIPMDWTLIKIKYLPFQTIENSFVDGDWIEAPYITDEGIRYLTTGNIGDGVYKSQGNGFISENTFKILNCKYAYPNDLVISRLNSPYGRSCLLNDEYDKYVLAVDNVILRTEHNKKFLCYVTQCNGYQAAVEDKSSGTTMKRISRTNLGNIIIPLPLIQEQEKISTYLDSKCSEIDALISDIQQQIETLEEYKRSVITEAVTKGLDPDVEMKDSGDDWIGEIPEHWKIMRIGRLFHLRNEKNYLPMEQVQLLSLYTDIGVFPHGEHEERGNKAVTVEGYNIVKKNDIVVNIILAWMGAIGISNYDGVTSPAYDVYVPDLSKVVPHYFHYVFRTSGIAGECYKYGRGIMMMRWRTYSSEFKLINVPYPDLEEQQQIADYLDEKCAGIDAVISEKKQQIETIEEYKKSLIFEYVTGKKEVE